MGKSVLPVHDICGIFYDYRSVPEHYHICKRDVGVVLTEISAHKWCAFDPVKMCIRDRSRSEHSGIRYMQITC